MINGEATKLTGARAVALGSNPTWSFTSCVILLLTLRILTSKKRMIIGLTLELTVGKN